MILDLSQNLEPVLFRDVQIQQNQVGTWSVLEAGRTIQKVQSRFTIDHLGLETDFVQSEFDLEHVGEYPVRGFSDPIELFAYHG